MVKVEHTVFVLPFAFPGAFPAARGLPHPAQIGWILLAMVGARSAAMAFNRLVDLVIDLGNPRTAGRALPQKLATPHFVVAFTVASSAVFVFAAAMLNPPELTLGTVALGIVFFGSLTKRFTWLSRFFLGLSLPCAPVGAWIAVRGRLDATPLLGGMAVAFWVAGLDIIYVCRGLDSDRKMPLHSIPKRFGLAGALRISGLLHLVMVMFLAWLFWWEGPCMVSFAGLAGVALLLAYEYSLVKPTDLSRMNTAFFTSNGWISVLLFATASIDLLWFRAL